MEYEYVNRSEYRPIQKELEDIIHRVQSFLKKKYKMTFHYQLIGSGKHHLITRVKGGNRGFDFDYNLIIPPPNEGYKYKGKVVKDEFIEAFQNAVKGTSYRAPENSTSVITIKCIDKENGRILHSCDFAIVYYPYSDKDRGYKYIKKQKDGNYLFVDRFESFDADSKLKRLLNENRWNSIRDEYLKIKNINRDKNKHSFVLYLEAINNVYNQLYY